METATLALNAMNTRFELVLHGNDPVALRAAGEEALREIGRLEALLSAFKSTSEIAHINARAGSEPVQVSPEVFALLLKARELWEQTEGALDITVGPLMRCWGFWGASGALPEPEAVETALASVGQSKLQLDPDRRTVRFEEEGMTVDLGAIGKGYAIDRAVELLRDSGVLSALLHGGTSTAYAMGVPPRQPAWRTAVRITAQSAATAVQPPEVPLEDEALSVSAAAEKSFTVNGRTFGHVIDPRTGWPCDRAELSLVVLPDAVEADAWSTALMVLGADGLERFERSFPGMRGMVVSTDGTARSVGRNAALPGDPAGQ